MINSGTRLRLCAVFADEICELNSRLNPACKLWMCFIVKLQEGRWELLGLYIQFTHCVLFFGFFVSFCLQSRRVTDLSVTIKKYVVYHPAWFHCCFLSVDGNERRKNNTLKSVSLVSLGLSHRFGFFKEDFLLSYWLISCLSKSRPL